MTETRFNVPDMSCAHCKAAVESSLNAISGVERSNADLGSGVVEVAYDENRVTSGDLVAAVESAGYTVES